jgi:hypothetical protein
MSIIPHSKDTSNWTSLMLSGMIAAIVINYTTCPDKPLSGFLYVRDKRKR